MGPPREDDPRISKPSPAHRHRHPRHRHENDTLISKPASPPRHRHENDTPISKPAFVDRHAHPARPRTDTRSLEHNLARLKAIREADRAAWEGELTGYRHDLFVFEATFKQQVKEYRAEAALNPWYHEYEEIRSRLSKILALPYRLAKWTETRDVSHLERALADCKSILFEHNRYPVLFAPKEYLDTQGFQQEPTFGSWSHDGQEHELLKLIQDVQKVTSDLVAQP
jgi:hypothetical protein